MVIHCCEDMNMNVYNTDGCTFSNTDDEKTLYYSSKFREYGVPVRDGIRKISSSYIIIHYCPWCGKKLPTSKREEWFDKLEEMGYDSPLEQDIPHDYRSSAWYEKDY